MSRKDGVVTVFDFTLSSALQSLGWSAEPWDYCWLACDRAGYRKDVGGHMIVLCPDHIEELEASSQHGYSQADPPEDAARMPSVGTWAWDRWMDKYWWPWQPIRVVAGEDV